MTATQINELIKQKRNVEFIFVLLKELPLLLANKQESPFMHSAVMFDNINAISLLAGLGFDINAKNPNGQTPLLLACQNHSYEAVQLLLALGADVLVADASGKNALQILLQKGGKTPSHLIGDALDRLKKSALGSSEIAHELMKADCSIDRILALNNLEVTREMLICTSDIDEETLCSLLKSAVYLNSMENARLLLQYGSDPSARRRLFVDEVTKNIFYTGTKPFFEQLVIWDVIDDVQFMKDIAKKLRIENEEFVQTYLDINIDKYCRQKFGYELLVSLFGNKTINIGKLLRNRQFDFNSRVDYGDTALHLATQHDNEKGVAYLLDNGANPNVKSRLGLTPIYWAYKNRKIAKLLLEAGADIQAQVWKNEHGFATLYAHFKELIVPHLLILKARGVPLKDSIRELVFESDWFNRVNEGLKDLCESLNEELNWMKTRWVSQSITLFTVLTEKFERLARYVKDENVCAEILNAINDRQLNSTYFDMLIRTLQRACKVNKLRLKAATFLCDKINIANSDHLVIRMIVELFTYKDLLVINEIEEV